MHRPEFVDFEALSLIANPLLLKKDGTWCNKLGYDCYEQGANAKNWHSQQAAGDIDGAFPKRHS